MFLAGTPCLWVCVDLALLLSFCLAGDIQLGPIYLQGMGGESAALGSCVLVLPVICCDLGQIPSTSQLPHW